MDNNLTAIRKISPFSHVGPDDQQSKLALSTAGNIGAYLQAPYSKRVAISNLLEAIVVDNSWVVEGLRDPRAIVRGALAMVVFDNSPEVSTMTPEEITATAFRFSVAVTTLSFMDDFRLNDVHLLNYAKWLLATDEILSMPGAPSEIDPSKILPLMIASLFAADEVTVPNSGRRFLGGGVIPTPKPSDPEVASAAARIEDQWEVIIPVLPELISRKTLDQGVIDVLVSSNVVSLREGEL